MPCYAIRRRSIGIDTAEHKSRDCLRKGVQVAGLEAARIGQIHLGDVVELPLLSILDVGVRFRLIVALSLHLCIETAHS